MNVTSTRMPAPDAFLHADPVQIIEGGAALVWFAGGRRFTLHGSAAGPYFEGWQPRLLYTGFAPVLVLQLVHPRHGEVVWYVSGHGERLGDRISSLRDQDRQQLRSAATPILRGLLDSLIGHAGPVLSSAMRGYLALDARCRSEVLALCRDLACPPVQAVALRDMPEQILANPGDDLPPAILHRAFLQAALELDLQGAVAGMIETAALAIPCPITGAQIASQGSLCFDDFHFAYRFVDTAKRLVFYLVAGQERSFVYALFIPCLALVFHLPDMENPARDIAHLLPEWLSAHALDYGTLFETYLSRPLAGISSPLRAPPWTHLGHQLWNELSGMDRLLQQVPDGAPLPEFVVPDGERPVEFYGPVDILFPRLSGHVRRGLRDADGLIRYAYANGRLVVRITSDHVSAELRHRLLAYAGSVAGKLPHTAGSCGLDRPARTEAPPPPVILLGLRVENRTLVNLGAFYERLAGEILTRHPGARFLVDGHNVATAAHQKFGSHGEQPGQARRIELAEQAVLDHLQARYGANVVIGAVGLTMQANLRLIDRCDGFVSMWGAGLAKYRWACNRPGYVITGRWNLANRPDLHIYDLPSMMEDPAPMQWVRAGLVTDHLQSPRLLEHLSHPQWSNFSVDEPAVIADILTWLDSLTKRPHPS